MITTYDLINLKIYSEIKDIIKNNEQIHILDVGSSNFSRYKNLNYKNKKITLFDIKFKKKYKIKNTKYVLGNVKNIEKYFKKNSFDIVCAIDLIEHLKKKRCLYTNK